MSNGRTLPQAINVTFTNFPALARQLTPTRSFAVRTTGDKSLEDVVGLGI